MFNFEDELIIEPGYSCLIWVQLLVILLIFVLCSLTIFAIDFSKTNTTDINSTTAIASSSTTRFLSHTSHNGKIRIDPNPPRNAQVCRISACLFNDQCKNFFICVAGVRKFFSRLEGEFFDYVEN